MTWRNRPVARRMLSKRKDCRVGYVQVSDVFELVHYYHSSNLPRQHFEHHFCYRNYTLESLTFDREIVVEGPVDQHLGTTASKLALKARQASQQFIEHKEYPACATLDLNSTHGADEVVTDVKLNAVPPFNVPIPMPLPLNPSVGPIERLDACCQKL
jgi:hypothetical protein